MSGDSGLVIMILGALTLLTSMAERVVAYRRWLEVSVSTVLEPALRTAFPPPPQARDLERLAAEAEAVLESHQICRKRQYWHRRHYRTDRGR